jgi:Transposase IS116/IS110/IS902 family
VVGAVFGLKPSRYQSGESERTGRISRCGDEMMRIMLYEAAQSMLAPNSAGACAAPNHGRSSRRCGLGSRRSWVAFLAAAASPTRSVTPSLWPALCHFFDGRIDLDNNSVERRCCSEAIHIW